MTASDEAGYGRDPVVRWSGSDAGGRLVVLLHGHGGDVDALDHLVAVALPTSAVAVVRGPLAVAPSGWGWFEADRPGVPHRASLDRTVAWLAAWLREVAPGADPRPVLVGHSAGGATAAALALHRPGLIGGLALVHASVPDTDVTVPGRLAGLPTLVVHGAHDRALPAAVLERTWRYLHERSGAGTVGVRHDGGHDLTSDVAAIVGDWLRSLDRGAAQDAAHARPEPERSHGRVHGARR